MDPLESVNYGPRLLVNYGYNPKIGELRIQPKNRGITDTGPPPSPDGPTGSVIHRFLGCIRNSPIFGLYP